MRIFAPVALRHIGLIWARGPLGRLVGPWGGWWAFWGGWWGLGAAGGPFGAVGGPLGTVCEPLGAGAAWGECAFLWLERHFGGLCCKLGLSFPIMG